MVVVIDNNEKLNNLSNNGSSESNDNNDSNSNGNTTKTEELVPMLVISKVPVVPPRSSNNSSETTPTSKSSLLTLKLKEKERESMDQLVKLYSGDSFNSWIGVSHLFKHNNSQGITDFICNRLYSLEDKDIDFYITQLCVILMNQNCDQISQHSSLARFILDRCSKSIRFAIKSYWIFQALEEDGARNLNSIEKSVVFNSPTSSPKEDVHQYTNEQITPIDLDKFYNSIDNYHDNTINNNSDKNNDEELTTFDNFNQKNDSENTGIKILNNNNNNKSNNSSNGISPSTSPINNKIMMISSTPIDDINTHGHFVQPNDTMENINCTLRGNKQIYKKIEEKKELAIRLREFSEMSFIKCSRPVVTRPRTSSLPQDNNNIIESNDIKNTDKDQDSNITENNNNNNNNNSDSKTPPIGELKLSDYDFEFEMTKSYRCDYFNEILSFVQKLNRISKQLIQVPQENRQAKLKHEISLLNIKLPLGLYLPMWQSSNHHCIVRIPPEEVKILNSRERVPYLLVLEIIESDQEALSMNIFEIVSSYLQYTTTTPSGSNTPNSSSSLSSSPLNANHLMKLDYMKKYFSDKIQQKVILNNNMTATNNNNSDNINNSNGSGGGTSTPPISVSPTSNSTTSPNIDKLMGNTNPLGESWEEKVQRYRVLSPYGHLKNWRLCSVIVKTGDDCRQEQMAVQLISKFQEIWKVSKLPLYLRPYSILVTGSVSGLIETIPDTISLHNLKKAIPNYTSLLNYFKSQYGVETGEAFRNAQTNFIESLAAYSVVTYLLQVKDRHNGNILLDREGHIVHIDFGFILSNSPGNMYFESAPFKLLQEWVDLMGGVNSSQFQYFKVLCSRGFVEARNRAEEIISLIEIMLSGPKMSCFKGGRESIEQLKQRFNLSQTEREAQKYFEDLITLSINHYKTRYYDTYQSWYNGIL